MLSAAIRQTPAFHLDARTSVSPTPAEATADVEGIIAHFIQRGALQAESRASSYVRAIFTAPPEALRVSRIARRTYSSRRTLGRHFRAEGLPAPIEWVALARAACAHRTIVRGGPLRLAASAAGYAEQFAMSNAIRRITGLRPSQLRNVSWDALLDVWIARQRERGALMGPPPAMPMTCPLCHNLRAS